ncbi:ribose-phosphate pyrophosphokinase-like domain-containing protein, partial [Salmonella enterica]|uniref:ribose-phosphate pyrophosphokinase-like domain-containing protein n=1 Tax=Salmonella enterica TaxID=28901 RepID=UPI001657AB40
PPPPPPPTTQHPPPRHPPRGAAPLGRLSEGEVSIQINEKVRGGDISIIQSAGAPPNDTLMELVVRFDPRR